MSYEPDDTDLAVLRAIANGPSAGLQVRKLATLYIPQKTRTPSAAAQRLRAAGLVKKTRAVSGDLYQITRKGERYL